jgi:hypothetical protein
MTKASQKRVKRLSARAATEASAEGSGGATGEGPAVSGRRAKGISGVPGSKNDSRRCKAKAHRTGDRCKAPAMIGQQVCRVHGGATPGAIKSAKERLLELADPAIAALSKIVRDVNTEDAVRLRAALGVLDRIGYGPGTKIELGVSKFEETMAEVLVDRSTLPAVESGPTPLDLLQHAEDARSSAWRGFDAEDDQRASSGRIYPDENTVRGEVVDNEPPRYWDQEARDADR